MDRDEKAALGALATGVGLVFLAIVVKLAFWVAVIYGIVRLVQHFLV